MADEITLKDASADVTTNVMLYDNTTGAPKTGLAYDDAGFTMSYVRAGAARVAETPATQAAAGAHSNGGFVEIDATNCPGLYRADWSDAAFAAGVNMATLSIKGSNFIHKTINVSLTMFDPANDTVATVTNTGTVTGNVDGNVAGSVASVTDGVSLAAAAITSAAYDAATAFPTVNDVSVAQLNTACDTVTVTAMGANVITAASTHSDYVAEINATVDTALSDINLDHLMKTAVASNADMTTEVADGTVLSNIISATSDTSTYTVADDSLEGLSGVLATATTIKNVVIKDTGISIT